MSAALDRLSKLERAATPGSWKVGFGAVYDRKAHRVVDDASEADAALIAAMRNALPRLIAVAKAAPEALQMLQDWIAGAETFTTDDAKRVVRALRSALAALEGES